MEWVFVALLVLGVPIALVIWLIVRAVQTGGKIEEMARRLGALESEVLRLKEKPGSTRPVTPVATPATTLDTLAQITQKRQEGPSTRPAQAPPVREPEKVISPPAPSLLPKPVPPAAPPPIPEFAAKQETAPPPFGKTVPAINWEQFMGVKLFAWIGGLALLLGIVFFVKYSFDRNWITPQLRVALGFLTGIGLLAGGTWLHRKKQYTVGAQTLCATGVVILYAVTFACRSIYHFQFFGVFPTFLLMVLITTTAFLLAVRLNALVVAVLGMLGGFLTPYLLSTGVDNPLGLFGYIAILDVGLIVVALNRRWFFLTALAALGTAIMQAGWADEFFVAGKYFEGNKILIALTVLLGFNALYLAAAWAAKRRGQADKWLSGSALGLVAVALAFTVWLLTCAQLIPR